MRRIYVLFMLSDLPIDDLYDFTKIINIIKFKMI